MLLQIDFLMSPEKDTIMATTEIVNHGD